MIIPVAGIKTLEEYQKNKENLKEISRPSVCPKCGAQNCFWKHGSYIRKALDGARQVEVEIFRYVCRYCRMAVSCLFEFLIPYSNFVASVACSALENYSKMKTSYRLIANEMSDLNDSGPPKPSSSQIFRWINSVSLKVELFLFLIQKEIVMLGKADKLNAIRQSVCPNAIHAKKLPKRKCLSGITEMLAMSEILVTAESSKTENLYARFLCGVESLQAIFTNHQHKLSTTQNTQQAIF